MCLFYDTFYVAKNFEIEETKTLEETEMSQFLMDMWLSVAYSWSVWKGSINWNKSDSLVTLDTSNVRVL